MGWLVHRRDAPPAEALAVLDRGERVVSWADTRDSVVLATPRGLWWPEPRVDGWRLIGWQAVSKAVWRDGAIRVVEADVVDDLLLADRDPVAVELTVPRDLPPTVRRRIEQNIAHTELAEIPGGWARIVARRVPGADGLRWWARLEQGTPRNDRTRLGVAARIDLLRTEWERDRAAANL